MENFAKPLHYEVILHQLKTLKQLEETQTKLRNMARNELKLNIHIMNSMQFNTNETSNDYKFRYKFC